MTTPEERIAHLEDRLARLTVAVYRAGVLAACAAIVLAFLVPFLQASTDEKDDTLSILDAVFSIADAGGGPFEEAAQTAAILIGLLALVAVAALVGIGTTWSTSLRPKTTRVSYVLSGLLLAASVGGWLLVAVLAGHFDGQVSAFSPALAFLTAGAVIGVALHKYDAT